MELNNPNTFDEASAATEEMFANEQMALADAPYAENMPTDGEPGAEAVPAEEVPAEPAPTENAPTAEEPTAQQPAAEATPSAMEQAVQAAELAAQTAAEKDRQLKEALAKLEAATKKNEQLQGTIDEMSRQNTETIIEEALTPPTLDIDSLTFADEEARRAAMAKYAEDLSEYNRKQIMKELSPTLEFAKKGMRDAEAKDAIAALSQIPELAGIGDMLPQLDRIIAGNKWLQSEDMPLDEKYINAYAIARGVNSMNTPPPAPPEPPKEPTPEEMLELYNKNPAFQELVEKQRLETIKQSQQVPPFSASSGAVNAALNIKEKPKTLEEASARTREMFGGM